MIFKRKIQSASGKKYAVVTVPRTIYLQWQEMKATRVSIFHDEKTGILTVIPLSGGE
jgi:hypothetical protein